MLYRRGDTFTRLDDYQSPGWAVVTGELGGMMTVGWGDNISTEGGFRYEAGYPSGRSASEPLVVAAWGDPVEPRPVIHGGFSVIGQLRNAVVSSLDIQPSSNPLLPGNRYGLNFGNPAESVYGAWRNVIIEDCRSQGHSMIAISGGGPSTNLVLRRCVYADGWNADGHNSSPFNGLADGARLTFEECVFDRNGYKENPDDATRWTGDYVSSLSVGGADGLAEPGTGVQPTRTWFDRNWYMSGAAGDTLVLRGNIAARTGGGAEQMRSGGVAERNLFLFEHDGLMMGAPEDSYGVHDTLVKQNVFLHDDVMLPPGGWGMNNFAQGGTAVIADNVFAHPHPRGTFGQNGPGSFFLWNSRNYEQIPRVLVDNVFRASRSRGFATQRSGESLDHPILTVTGNRFAIDTPTGYGLGGVSRASKSAADTVDGNMYLGDPNASRFTAGYSGSPQGIVSTNRSFLQWQADGYDTASEMIANWESFKAAAGWTAPDRDIVSYMQSIDPTYAPDENVRVDFGVAVPQGNAAMVRTVVLGTGATGMTDAEARLAAKRFHAAVTFLERARENRKGNWDDRYTADAVNDYIRQGFGKGSIRPGSN